MAEMSADQLYPTELRSKLRSEQFQTLTAATKGIADAAKQRLRTREVVAREDTLRTSIIMDRSAIHQYYTELAAVAAIEEILSSKQGQSLSSDCQDYVREYMPVWLEASLNLQEEIQPGLAYPQIGQKKSLSLFDLLKEIVSNKERHGSPMSLDDNEFSLLLNFLYELQKKFFDDNQSFIPFYIFTQPQAEIKKTFSNLQPATFEKGLSFPQKNKEKTHASHFFYLLSDFGDRLLRVTANSDHPAQEQAVAYIKLLEQKFGSELVLGLLSYRIIGEDITNYTDVIPWLRDLFNTAEDEDDPWYENLAQTCIGIIRKKVPYILLTSKELEDNLKSIPLPATEDLPQTLLPQIRDSHHQLEGPLPLDDDASFFIIRDQNELRRLGFPENITRIVLTSPKEKNLFGYHSYHLLFRFSRAQLSPYVIIVVHDTGQRILASPNTIDPYTTSKLTDDRLIMTIYEIMKDERDRLQTPRLATEPRQQEPSSPSVPVVIKPRGVAQPERGPDKRPRLSPVAEPISTVTIKAATTDIRPNQYPLAIAKNAFQSQDGRTRKELENAIQRYQTGLRHGKFILGHLSPNGLPVMEIKTRHWRILFEIKNGTAHYLETVAKKDFETWMKNVAR